jgi:hypothetical protein
MSQSTSGFQTNRTAGSSASEAARVQMLIRTLLSRVRTAMPVQVKAVTNDGGVSPIGYVDIQPLVGQLDGDGTVYPHGIIYNVPYMRIQGGANAVILDPQVGDLGMALVCDRDISAVKNSGGKASPPGSKRRHDMSDAVYLSTIIGGAPEQYVRFSDEGIDVVSPVKVTITAPTADVIAAVSANVTAPAINLGASGQSLLSFVTSAFVSLFNGHTHPGDSGGNTGTPNQTMGSAQLTSTVKGG